eukprot:NODE_9230_length_326_cov_28.570397_g7464_i0.p2 GENE.NODE_9230_length_326_cov_28.570397_g7464_i0~~NODE_9230_length_326_cov_28.570397_g7464_i0.p2  ORF type:complete len:63 (-),score=14.40 NODE_9230_length_326_cov_28.570397_g7464_i0:138-305(-)
MGGVAKRRREHLTDPNTHARMRVIHFCKAKATPFPDLCLRMCRYLLGVLRSAHKK